MKVRVLGCHGSDQVVRESGGVRGCCTCGFLVNESLLLEAGTIGRKLDLDEQRRIRVVLLTHSHFDHIQGLPTLADNLVGHDSAPVLLVGLPETLRGLRDHVFNETMYPDFFCLPDPARPVFRAETLVPGHAWPCEGFNVLGVSVNHTVPAVGYLLSDPTGTLLYSGDTHDTDELWQRAATMPSLKAVFVETSYPDAMADLARASKHLTPSLLGAQLRKLGRPDVAVYVYHVKPRFRDRIRAEVAQLELGQRITFLEEDQVVHLT